MKKSLIALAVLAASGASFAQSSVTLYGTADIWFGSVKNEVGTGGVDVFGSGLAAGTSLRTTKLDSSGVNTSKWGMMGSEDLGGGLKANFVLEQAFNVDDGTADAGFTREASVGFSGGFGAVKLGKMATAYDDVSGSSDALFDANFAPMYDVALSTAYIGRPSNTIKYQAPNFGGFSGAVSYSLDEKVPTATNVASMNLTYGAGPVAAQFAYQVEDTDGVADKVKFTRLGGSYDFGMAVAKLTYGNTKFGDAKSTDYQIGVDVPVSAALTVSGSYVHANDNADLGDDTRKGYGIAAAYNLSKRTMVYAGYTNVKSDDTGDKKTLLAVGVSHKF